MKRLEDTLFSAVWGTRQAALQSVPVFRRVGQADGRGGRRLTARRSVWGTWHFLVVVLLAWESAGRALQCDELRPPRSLVPMTEHVMYTSQPTKQIKVFIQKADKMVILNPRF